MLIRSSTAARAVRGRMVGEDREFDGVSFDTRTTTTGEAFIALSGERDGHDFLTDAVRTSDVLIVSRGRRPDGFSGTTIEVDDTSLALLALGRLAREQFDSTGTKVIGITGSVGKTSTKDFTAAALSSALRRVTSSRKSFNNDIGVPVTLLRAAIDSDAVVLEMAMRGFGEIARLCDIARPHVAVVTRVGEAHTDRVGGIEGVARAKAELVSALSAEGVAVLNADDPRVLAMAHVCRGHVVTYSMSADANVVVRPVATDDEGRVVAEAVVASTAEKRMFRCPVPGAHMMSNAAAAVTVAHVLGVSLHDACDGIERAALSTGRMRRVLSRGGAVIIDDSYNANPTSVEAALRTLASLDVPRKVAVLGVMAEISDPVESHARIAEMAREFGIELMVVDTDLFGVPVLTVDDAIRRLSDADDGVAILVKGSRVAQLERVVYALAETAGE